MKKIGQIIRLCYIHYIMAKHGIDQVILSAPLFSPFRFLSWLNPWNWVRSKKATAGESLRLALEALGPIFVKFGQILSTRQDLFSPEIILELEKLQDQVLPFSAKKAQAIVEETLKKPVSVLFAEFSVEPLASASIAQVHAATLLDGRKVVVKIRRPDIEKIIRRDLGLLYFVAKLTAYIWADTKRLRLRELVEEFEHTILAELDFLCEASNASQLRRNFEGSRLLYVPEIYWPYTTKNVLVMERIFGIMLSDIAGLKAAGVNLKKLSENGVEIFFTQVFKDSFFHADMHPGNIFVSTENPENPQYRAIDFGIMGSLGVSDQHYLAENLFAFFNRDYRRVAILHVESGWIPVGTRVEEFESAIRSVCEPIFEKPLRDISFAQLLLRLFQTAGRFNMEIQPQLFLLQKTLLNIEALGRKLDPDLDLWATAKPFLGRWIRRRYSPRTLLKKWVRQAPYMADKLASLPGLVHDVLQQQKHANSLVSQASRPVNTHKKIAVVYFLLGIGVTILLMYIPLLLERTGF